MATERKKNRKRYEIEMKLKKKDIYCSNESLGIHTFQSITMPRIHKVKQPLKPKLDEIVQ